MNHRCPKCKTILAKEDLRKKKEKSLKVIAGELLSKENTAPKLRCPCGQLVVLLKGSLLW